MLLPPQNRFRQTKAEAVAQTAQADVCTETKNLVDTDSDVTVGAFKPRYVVNILYRTICAKWSESR